MKPLILVLSMFVPVAVASAGETVPLSESFSLSLAQTSHAPSSMPLSAAESQRSDTSDDFPERYHHYVELLHALPKGCSRAELYAALPPLSTLLPQEMLDAIGAGVFGTGSYPIDADFEVVASLHYRHGAMRSPDDTVCGTPLIQARLTPPPPPNHALQRTSLTLGR